MLRRNKPYWILQCVLLGGLLGSSLSGAAQKIPLSSSSLVQGFKNPPQSARMQCYWWWLNGNTDEATITHDLEEMKAKGYGGANLVDANGADQNGNLAVPAGPTFDSPRWRQLYLHALSEAARLHLEISLNITSGWNLGGPMVKPEEAAKVLTWSRLDVDSSTEAALKLPQPPTRNGFYRDIAVLAYPLLHGEAMAGNGNSRHPIRNLKAKAAFIETGFSIPDSKPLLMDYPAQTGEEDTRLAEVQDVTSHMTPDGRLQWKAPAGTWEILRIGYTDSGAKVSTASGAWQGLAIDYLDHRALQRYWQQVVAPLLEISKPYIGKSLKYLVTDSWELGGVNWTGNFREEFKQRRGYDPVLYLPIVTGRIVEDRETSDRFLNDLRRTVGDLVVDQHYKVFAELAQSYGLGIHPESGGPHGAPIDAIETLGVSTYPQTEFWATSPVHRSTDAERFFVKEASSAAHVYGKNIVAAEGMTSIGPQWEEAIWNDLKPTFDHGVTEGLNLLIWHEFTSSPKSAGLPGLEYFAGTHLNPKVTWWNQAGPFIQYINRSDFLMQQGKPVSDVLYYYGDQVPNFARLKSSDPAQVLPGYDYDVIDEDALLHRAAVRDGRIVLPDGTSYRLLVLPPLQNISLPALRKIQQLVAQGASIEGEKPVQTTGLTLRDNGDHQVRAIANAVWGNCDGTTIQEHSYEKGSVFCGDTAREVLSALKVAPDFAYATKNGNVALDYIHRKSADVDIYFVRNELPEPVQTEATFRVYGKLPELWHADTGRITSEAMYGFTADKRTQVPLWLEPYGSIFVVFRRPDVGHVTRFAVNGENVFPSTSAAMGSIAHNPYLQMTTAGSVYLNVDEPGNYQVQTSDGKTYETAIKSVPPVQPVQGSWLVHFAPGWRAPATAEFSQLQSWTESKDPGIRYYSGTATYEKTIQIPEQFLQPNRRVYLNLGDVREIATVRLNGKTLGIVWKKPFRILLNGAAKVGPNQLEIEITNLWPNRIIGDQLLPPSQRLTHTNITKFTKDSPLIPSGLLGPVSLSVDSEVQLKPEENAVQR
ncbi:MAG: glycosyl hydrolase [Acidobacteriaceae bacterium]